MKQTTQAAIKLTDFFIGRKSITIRGLIFAIYSATTLMVELQVAAFIDKFEPEHAALIRSVREFLRKRLRGAHELVYDNYNFFVIGYCSSEKPSDCIVSIAAAANGVGLSFYHGATLPDPHQLLLGSGSQNRFIRIESLETLSRPEVDQLIASAIQQASTPLTPTTESKLIIRSISEKQKPRRKTKVSSRPKSVRIK